MRRNILKILALIAALAALCAFICACNDLSDTQDSQTDQPSEDATDNPKLPDAIVGNEFIIFENGVYNCNIVCSDTASDAEKDIYNQLRNKLKSLTGVNPTFTTDFVAFNDTGANRETPAILIGETNFEESRGVYSELNYGTGVIELVGNKLVVAFPSLDIGNILYVKLLSSLESKSADKVSVNLDILPYSKVANPSLAALPVYPEKQFETLDGGDDTSFLRLSNVDEEDFEAYQKMLTDTGYTLSGTREAGPVSCATYIKGENYVYTYYKSYTHTIRAIVGPVSHLPNAPEKELEEITEPSFTMVSQSDSDIGLGMVFRLTDGRFVIVDGGAYYSDDLVYKALKSQAVTEEITIAAWFLTHAHSDHHGGFTEFVNKHKDEVKIESVIFNFAATERYKAIDGEEDNYGMTELRQKIRRDLPDTKFIKPHTGQTIEFGDTVFEIMYTAEDFYPSNFEYLNDTSLVVRAHFASKSILMLADATHQAGNILVDTYLDYLQSDMVQLAHHGIWASTAALYNRVNAAVLLWPSNSPNAANWIDDSSVKAALAPARDVYLPNGSTITINFPYEFIDNKNEFIDKHRALNSAE